MTLGEAYAALPARARRLLSRHARRARGPLDWPPSMARFADLRAEAANPKTKPAKAMSIRKALAARGL